MTSLMKGLKHHILSTSGLSVLQLSLYSLLGASLMKVAITAGVAAFDGYVENRRQIVAEAKNEISLRALKSQIERIRETAFTENILISNTLAQFMGIGTQIGWTWKTPPCGLFKTSVASCGSALTTSNRLLNAKLGSVSTVEPLDLVTFITKDPAVPPLVLAKDVTYHKLASIREGTIHRLEVIGDTKFYKKGDVVAAFTPFGIEFLPLTENAKDNSISFVVKYSTLPVQHMATGMFLFKVKTMIVGSDSIKRNLRIVTVAPATGLYQDVVNERPSLKAIYVSKTMNIMDTSTWANTRQGQFNPGMTQNTFKAQWAGIPFSPQGKMLKNELEIDL